MTSPQVHLQTYTNMNEQRLDAATALRIIKSRKLITSPGKYTAVVINEPNHHEDKVIMNLKATTSPLVEQAKQDFRDGEFDKAANSNLSYSTFADTGYKPSQGEHVSIMVDYVPNREGKQILAIVSLNEIQSKSADKVSLGDEFENMLDEVTSGDTATKSDEPELD